MKKILALVLCLALASTMFAVPALALTRERRYCNGIWVWYGII